MNKKNMRSKHYANKMHKDIFTIIFVAAVVPATIVAICLYYLIFYITAEQIAIPEAIAYNLIPAAKKVLRIVLYAVPISILIILIFARTVTHKIVGPFDRIVRELDGCLKGKKQTHITLRKGDRFQPLVNRINKLLDRLH